MRARNIWTTQFMISLFSLALATTAGAGERTVAGESEASAKAKASFRKNVDGAPAAEHPKHTPAQRKEPHEAMKKKRAPADAPKPWWQWEHATGDWNGARSQLESKGVLAELVYVGEVLTNTQGGLNTKDATEYHGNLDFTLTLDTEKMGLWRGGTFFFYAIENHGGSLTEKHVGDIQTLSNIDAVPFTQTYEYWYEQRLLEDKLRIKFGKQDANADFCALDFGGNFIQSSFGFIPTIPLITFPDPSLGLVAFVEPTNWLSLGAGIYDGNPNPDADGVTTAFDGQGGTFSILELALKPKLAGRPGTYRFGAWKHTDDVEEITADANPETLDYNYGFYLAFDQLLYQENPGEEDEQGLGMFLQYGWAPNDRSEIARYYGGGVVYTGLFPGRDEDVLGLGVAHARLSNRLGKIDGLRSETAIELFYKAQLTPWFTIQPDVQYIIDPGGAGKDAVAAGFRFEISF